MQERQLPEESDTDEEEPLLPKRIKKLIDAEAAEPTISGKAIVAPRLTPLPPSRIPARVVNDDIVDRKHPNLLFRYNGVMYSVYCGLRKTGRDLRKAIWRVIEKRESDK